MDVQKANDESGKILHSCATRWLGRSDALASVVKSLVSIIDYVAELSAMSPATRKQALGRSDEEPESHGRLSIDELHAYFLDFKLLASLHFLTDLVGHLGTLSKAFQKPTLGIKDMMETLDATRRQIKAQYLSPDTFTWGDSAAQFLARVPNLNGEEPGSFKLGEHAIQVTAPQRDAFYCFVRDYTKNVLDALEERIPDEPLLRGLVEIFDPSKFEVATRGGDGTALAIYGAKAIDLVGAHFAQGRGGDGSVDDPNFLDAAALGREYLAFKADEFYRWRGLDMDAVLKCLVTQCKDKYPNLWLLGNVVLVLVVTNAACEGGFSLMKLTKGDLQGNMGTDTLNARMFVKLHGPALDDDDGVKALLMRVGKKFWVETKRVPGRAAGGVAAAKAKATNNEKKRKVDQVAADVKTAAHNEAIAASGAADARRETFNAQHGLTHYSIPVMPELGPALVNCRIAKIDDDGVWDLGKVINCKKKDTLASDGTTVLKTKFSYELKLTKQNLVMTKAKFRESGYGTDWVAYAKQ